MKEIIFSDAYHPVDKDTGKLLPTCRPFVIEGVGFGTAQVYHPEDGEEETETMQSIFPEVKITFVRPWTTGSSDGETMIVRRLDFNHSSLSVVGSVALLEPILRDMLDI